MADTSVRLRTCDASCGCPVPCPGGVACRFYTSLGARETGADDPRVEHKRCSCGQHCGCNPCTCSERVTTTAGCKCGAGCTCVSCSA